MFFTESAFILKCIHLNLMSLCKAEMQRESDNEARILFFMYGVVLVGVSACACMRVYVSCVCMRMRVRAYAPGGTLKADSRFRLSALLALNNSFELRSMKHVMLNL
mmetsp:Transcript_11704/g.30667  ORF Transcript_11704/g.30667 Transcript_11704/m.30667 type:complete len:106 (+) Transcript_11704:144-461(+)